MDQVTDTCDSTPRATFVPLRVIAHPKGDVRHAIKASESTFHGFGEAYFTTILPGHTKGWKKHRLMHMNLVVVQGEVAFHVHDEQSGHTDTYILGSSNYGRLYVPPGLWMAFSGRAEGPSMVLNLASIEHDPGEALSVDLLTFPMTSRG
ncbi:MAG: WxcM-like domain-containing protein [Terracidiphilus sp.]|jgi:dTDP-4-dehydrorhamnose 3,5-epimerase